LKEIEKLKNPLAWSDDYKLEIARTVNASFENVFNLNRNLFDVSGLSGDTGFNDAGVMYRTGYASHENVGVDEEWTSFSAGEAKGIVPGNGQTLIFEDKDIAWLGNQYNNNLTTGGGDDYIDGGKGDDVLVGYDLIDEHDGKDTLIGGEGSDRLFGGYENDVLYGDKLDGSEDASENNDDTLYGESGNDTLYGGKGSDTLVGGDESGADDGAADTLEGGDGFDTYIANNQDSITDSDGKGLVKFEGIDLTGAKYINEKTGRYEDDDYIYDGPLEGKGTLTVTSLKDPAQSITINSWENRDLGVELYDGRDIEVSITSSATADEGGEDWHSLQVRVSINRKLIDGESLQVSVPGAMVSGQDPESNSIERTITFDSNRTSGTFEYWWSSAYTITVKQRALLEEVA